MENTYLDDKLNRIETSVASMRDGFDMKAEDSIEVVAARAIAGPQAEECMRIYDLLQYPHIVDENDYIDYESNDQYVEEYVEEEEVVVENKFDPDCENKGSYDTVTYCTVCGEEVSRQLVAGSKLPHTEEIIPAKPATCKETGLTEGKMCSVCGEILVAQQSIPLAEHTYENGLCTECGHKQNSRCICVCHNAEKNFIVKFLYAIFRIIWKVFGVHQICACGDLHY